MAHLSLRQAREAYAEELCVIAGLRSPEIIKAFASVPREKFLGPGPWRIGTEFKRYRTPDDDPRWLYHNVLVTLDAKKGINNGSPSLWAFLLDKLALKPGEHVLQVGAGTGYYTAIIATIVGTQGRVTAVEFDRRLAAKARANLRGRQQVELVHGDAATFDPGQVDAIVVFAGGTHPASLWLERLAPGGRLLMPLVGDDRGGFVLKIIRHRNGFKAEAVSRCWFVLAEGFRTKHEAHALRKAFASMKGALPALRALHIGRPRPSERKEAFFIGRNYWLSRR